MKFIIAAIFLVLTIVNVRAQIGNVVGGIQDVKPEDVPGVIEKLMANMDQVNAVQREQGCESLTFVKETSVKYQIVSGILYIIEGSFANESGDVFNGTAKVWEQPWRNPSITVELIIVKNCIAQEIHNRVD